jgi:hypothetical protein
MANNKSIKLANKLSHEEQDIKYYRDFSNHDLFKINDDDSPNYHELFIFFMGVGIIYDKKMELEKKWNNVTVTNVSEKICDLITAISYKNNGIKNFNRPSALGNEAEKFAKGGLHYVLKKLDSMDTEAFINELSVGMIQRARKLRKLEGLDD